MPRVARRLAKARAERPVEVGEIGEAGHFADFRDPLLRQQRIAQHPPRALETLLAHIARKREAGAFEQELHVALGQAEPVRDYLISRGVQAQRMRTISYGKERPVAVCNDISCWSQNRRAVTVLNAGS